MHELIEWMDGQRGRRSALARALGITPSAITRWRQVPTKHLKQVSDITCIPLASLI